MVGVKGDGPLHDSHSPGPAQVTAFKSETMRADGNTTANGVEITAITNYPRG